MTNSIYPCLWFDGHAKAASDFYYSVFPDSKIISSNPMVVIFELNGKKIMALNGGPEFKINPSISFFVECESMQEVDDIWKRLLEGGKELMPLGKYAWSKHYGWLQDKFGMTWQIMINPESGGKRSLVPSLLFTSDRFGKAEEAKDFYSSLFKNSRTQMVQYYPKDDANAGKILFSEFFLNDYPLIAMDGPGVHDYSFNEAVSFVINCDTQKEIDYYWNAITKEGEEGKCGWCKDKYGIWWQVVPSVLGQLMSNPEKAPKVMYAFMQMKKFDIETLMQA